MYYMYIGDSYPQLIISGGILYEERLAKAAPRLGYG